MFLTGALAVQLSRALELSEVVLGVAFGSFFASASLVSAKMGGLAERWGAPLSLRVAVVAGLAVQLALGLLTEDAIGLICLLGAAGLVNALVQPAANLLLVRGVVEKQRGLAFGLKQAAIPAATLLSGAAVPTVALTLGWRWAYLLSSAVALIALALIPNSKHLGPQDAGTRSAELPADSRKVLRVLATSIACGAAAAGSLGAFLVASGVLAGLSEGSSGLVLTAGSLLGVAGRVALGAWADRTAKDPLSIVALLLLSGSLGFGLVACQTPASHTLGTLIAFGLGWSWPGLYNYAVTRRFSESPAAATGYTQTGTYLGALLGPLLFGWLAEHISYAAGWYSTAFFALAASVLASWGRVLLGSPGAGPTLQQAALPLEIRRATRARRGNAAEHCPREPRSPQQR